MICFFIYLLIHLFVTDLNVVFCLDEKKILQVLLKIQIGSNTQHKSAFARQA